MQDVGSESRTSSIFVPSRRNGTHPASSAQSVGQSWRMRLRVLKKKDTFIVETIISGEDIIRIDEQLQQTDPWNIS